MTTPNDIRLLAQLLARRHEERKFTVVGQTTEAIADDVARALMEERDRCASHLEQKAMLMRGSHIGDTMARIFEAEAIAIRNAHTLVPTNRGLDK